MSYQYSKKFIDAEVRILNEPLVLNTGEFEGIDGASLKKLQQAVNRVNINLRKHNRILFNSQIVEQVAQQIVKSEHKKLLAVDEMLQKLQCIMIPIVVPNLNRNRYTMNQFSELIRELPESKYLFGEEFSGGVSSGPSTGARASLSSGEEENEDDSDAVNETGLVQDEYQTLDQVEVDPSLKYEPKRQRRAQRHLKKQIYEQIQKMDTGRSSLLNEYDELREKLIALDAQLAYKVSKLEYLKGLKRSINQTFALEVPTGTSNGSKSRENLDSDEEIESEADADDFADSTSTNGLQKNLIYAAGSNGSEETSLYTELGKFRVLVEKLNYNLSKSSA
ncbi:hypothetical protein CLIB1423_03S04962 [[Candida] railenensis]|uniref:Uncharacterized protein n=1 Tax=[Candida] railenensis TaxID=45579 RepID=A0A9P0VWZ6_9ASCO|nr:hypothetical protein CLIB1423_03S04962 [[Candida] railenensis]